MRRLWHGFFAKAPPSSQKPPCTNFRSVGPETTKRLAACTIPTTQAVSQAEAMVELLPPSRLEWPQSGWAKTLTARSASPPPRAASPVYVLPLGPTPQEARCLTPPLWGRPDLWHAGWLISRYWILYSLEVMASSDQWN